MVGSFAQSKEAVFVYLAVYSVFVPIFQIHHLTMAMLLLTIVQMALFVAYGLVNNAGERETYKNMLALEAYIAVILNMLGVGIAHLADRQTRSNFSRAKSVPRGHTVALAPGTSPRSLRSSMLGRPHTGGRAMHMHTSAACRTCVRCRALQREAPSPSISSYLPLSPPTSSHLPGRSSVRRS